MKMVGQPTIFHKPAEQITLFLDWMVGTGIIRFDLALIRYTEAGPQGKFIPGPINVDRAGVMNSLSWLRYENLRGAGAYLRPARGYSWPIVFLDDVSPDMANSIAERYRSALIETSSNRYHLWIATNDTLDEHQRFVAQSALAKRLRADLGSVSGEHWGRLPGFTNRKPGKEGVWVNLRRYADGQRYDASMHDEDMLNLSPHINADIPIQTRAKGANRLMDHSALEWGFVCRSLEAGVPSDQVYRHLLSRCLNRRGNDAQRYAMHTVKKACKKIGMQYLPLD